ncbi:T9SS type A sorting domain-containing protein [candidate division KSB1 bacterium]|nr:T9SS type A sorting domain-containing protein [candidate division KSB1 bacterium]
MKHLNKLPLLAALFMGVLLAADPVFSAAGDSLIVTSGNGSPGSSGETVEIILKNAAPLRGLIFNLHDTANSIEVTNVQSTAFSSHFTPHFTTTPAGAHKILFMSDGTATNKTLDAGRNAIMTVTFNVKPEAEGGTQALITIDSLTVARTASISEAYAKKNGNFWLGEKGDVIYTGTIDLFDVLRMINIVLNRQPAPTPYEQWAGDLDGNGTIDIVDILGALDLALVSTTSLGKALPEITADDFAFGSARFTASAIPAGASGTFDLPIHVANSVPLSGVQLSFRIPHASLDLGQADFVAGEQNMTVRSRRSGDRYDILLCSLDGKTIAMGETELLRIPVRVSGQLNQDVALEMISVKAASETGTAIKAFMGTDTPIAGGLPQSFKLYPNSPNPFNMSTKIVYDVPGTADGSVHVRLAIYNTQGQLVRTLEDRERTPGQYAVQWDGLNSQGKTVSSGIYFYQLQAGDVVLSNKLAVMK